jgi:hypothetical protein
LRGCAGDALGQELRGVGAHGGHPAQLHDRALAAAQAEAGAERVAADGVDALVDRHPPSLGASG